MVMAWLDWHTAPATPPWDQYTRINASMTSAAGLSTRYGITGLSEWERVGDWIVGWTTPGIFGYPLPQALLVINETTLAVASAEEVADPLPGDWGLPPGGGSYGLNLVNNLVAAGDGSPTVLAWDMPDHHALASRVRVWDITPDGQLDLVGASIVGPGVFYRNRARFVPHSRDHCVVVESREDVLRARSFMPGDSVNGTPEIPWSAFTSRTIHPVCYATTIGDHYTCVVTDSIDGPVIALLDPDLDPVMGIDLPDASRTYWPMRIARPHPNLVLILDNDNVWAFDGETVERLPVTIPLAIVPYGQGMARINPASGGAWWSGPSIVSPDNVEVLPRQAIHPDGTLGAVQYLIAPTSPGWAPDVPPPEGGGRYNDLWLSGGRLLQSWRWRSGSIADENTTDLATLSTLYEWPDVPPTPRITPSRWGQRDDGLDGRSAVRVAQVTSAQRSWRRGGAVYW